MCRFYCITIIKQVIVGKSLLDYTSLFSHKDNKNDDKIICKYFNGKSDQGKHNSKI